MVFSFSQYHDRFVCQVVQFYQAIWQLEMVHARIIHRVWADDKPEPESCCSDWG